MKKPFIVAMSLGLSTVLFGGLAQAESYPGEPASVSYAGQLDSRYFRFSGTLLSNGGDQLIVEGVTPEGFPLRLDFLSRSLPAVHSMTVGETVTVYFVTDDSARYLAQSVTPAQGMDDKMPSDAMSEGSFTESQSIAEVDQPVVLQESLELSVDDVLRGGDKVLQEGLAVTEEPQKESSLAEEVTEDTQIERGASEKNPSAEEVAQADLVSEDEALETLDPPVVLEEGLASKATQTPQQDLWSQIESTPKVQEGELVTPKESLSQEIALQDVQEISQDEIQGFDSQDLSVEKELSQEGEVVAQEGEASGTEKNDGADTEKETSLNEEGTAVEGDSASSEQDSKPIEGEEGPLETVAPPVNATAGEGGQQGASQTVSEEVENPIVVDIQVEGNVRVPDSEILQIVSSRIGDPLLEAKVQRDLQGIYELGLFTDVRLRTPIAPGGVQLVFRVLENPVVNEVRFEGNEIVDSALLDDIVKTEAGEVLNNRLVQDDVRRINRYYDEDLGYMMSPSHVKKVRFKEGVLYFELEDGVVLEDIVLQGSTVYDAQRLSEFVTLKKGELFNRKTLEANIADIADFYDKDGWVLDTVDPVIDPDTGVLTLNVVEARIKAIKVEGNIKTKTDTILRNLRTKEGDVLNRDRFQKDLDRLKNLGFFRNVNPTPQPGREPGELILLLDVEEDKTGLATIGVGYAGGGTGGVRSGLTGGITLADKNLFGEGKSVSVSWQRGSSLQNVSFSYFDPAINHNQDSFGFTVYKSDIGGLTQPINLAGTQNYAYYRDKRIGGSVTYGRPLSDDFRVFATVRHETIDVLQEPYSPFVPTGIGSGTLNGVGLSAIYDTRDDLFDPNEGWFINASANKAGFGGDYDFTKFVVEARKYIPLGERQTLALRGWWGTVTGDAPVSEYFFAGGADTLRGYERNQFYGTRFVVGNVEYRFPIGNIKFLRGAVFVDAGNAWTPGSANDGKFFLDGGLGLRITFPQLGLGVIRLDYAFGDNGGRAAIGIGQSF